MKLTKIFSILLPTSVVWLITALFLLVYAFEILENVFQTESNLTFTNFGLVILFITAFIATISLYITGYLIDIKPYLIRHLISWSLVGSSVSLLLIVFSVDIIFLLIIGLPLLGMFLGILATSAGAIFAGFSDIDKRGRLYSGAIFFSATFCVITIPIIALLRLDYRFHLLLISIFSMTMGILFYYISHKETSWINDAFPTPLRRIIDRRPVKAYLLAHFFLYLMIGIALITISRFGLSENLKLPSDFGFTEININQSTLFWFSVFLGDLLAVLPMGWFSDKYGRKNLMVLGCYLIICSILIVALSEEILMYYLSAFLLGVSFATYHPTIDSAVWADLSPLDSVGRYNALGFIFLLQGIGCGLAVGLFINNFLLPDLSTISYILIAFAVLGLFPLFFVSDSYEPLDLYLLLLSRSGILVYNYDFHQEKEISNKDLTLVSGALSAISTIFEQTISESDEGGMDLHLDLVQHGNVFIVQARISTKKGYLIGTIFSNKNDPELLRSLEHFLVNFTQKYHSELDKWFGQPNVFKEATDIAEDVFGPLIPSKTFSKDFESLKED